MRSTGILRSWNDERGYGFIAPAQGGAELFVHASALPRDGSRPAVGETLSFELGRGRDGRVQAVKVLRTAVGAAAPPATRGRAGRAAPKRRSAWRGLASGVVMSLCLLGVAIWGWQQFRDRLRRSQPADMPPAATAAPDRPAPAGAADAGFRCDGRTHCTQMTSCAEATWFINHCPGTKMDGNGDGVPCEQQWCTGR